MASLNLYIVTFNCGRTLIDADALSTQIFKGTDGNLPDLILISLQEIAPIYASFIGGSFLVPYFAKVHDAVKQAVKSHNGSGYEHVSTRHVGMTALLAFSRNTENIDSIESAGVGVGTMEMGNKGAVGLRFKYNFSGASTELTFVAMHLAAMEDEVKRRNEDWKNIVRGLVFSSTTTEYTPGQPTEATSSEDEQPLLSISPKAAGLYKPTSHLFVAGDLNYRTSIIKPSPSDPETFFPQPNQPADSTKHYMSLFSNDQLTQELAAGRTCHGFVEAPVNFPPTYKYSSEQPFLTNDDDLQSWSWARHRWPSWCDRILYLDVPQWSKKQNSKAAIKVQKYIALPLMPTSDHRAVVSLVEIPLVQIPEPTEADDEADDPRIHPPFTIDANWKLRREKARQLELVVGFGAYFMTTLEGGAVVVATIMGILGGFFALRAILDF